MAKSLLERFEEEIDWLGNNKELDEKRYLSAISLKDYFKASEYQHDVMVLQNHREFVLRLKKAITEESLDAFMSGILNCIMSPSFVGERPKPYELAKLDAAREHWKLVTKIIKARDKDASA